MIPCLLVGVLQMTAFIVRSNGETGTYRCVRQQAGDGKLFSGGKGDFNSNSDVDQLGNSGILKCIS
jgi:hypothetical protein